MSALSIRLTALALASALATGISPNPAAASPAESPATVGTKATPERTVMFDGTVQTMAYRGDTIYLGGDLTHAIDGEGRSVARTRLAAMDARTGQLLAWNPRADARVRTLVVSSRGVYIGGDFTTVNGVARDALAQLDPVTGAVTPFHHTIYGHPHAIAVSVNRLYLGGTLTNVDGHAASAWPPST